MQNHAIDPFGIVGQVLDGQFRVDRLVGEGGFSAVYRGYHVGLQEPVAIKCLKLPPSLSPPLVDQFVKRFRDESRILYRLSQGNLNVVRSIAAGTWQMNTGLMVPYMILEWLEGRSLANEFTIRRTVGQQGRPLDEVVKLFAPAADGLGYAHSQGVVHRDLNPGNLFLASTPQGPRMKVLDFGVAKILDESTLNIARTQTVGQIRIFAPAYGAPEQFDDTIGTVGAASDVYAFALILLEALRDRSVNDGQHLGEFAQKAIDPSRRPTPRALGVDVPDEVEQIFARATTLDPRQRWQSAGELWQALAIAASAASQQRHAQAAMETPSLGMPQGVRSTKTGMAPPPEPQRKAPARMDKTMPLGAVFPKLDVPRSPAPSPAAGAPAGGSRSTQRFPGDSPPSIEREEELPTRVVMGTEGMLGETEEVVTRLQSPEADVLRDLAGEVSSHPNPGMATLLTQGPTPRPAAGNPMPTTGTVRPPPGAPPGSPIEPAPLVGTLMMAPGGFQPSAQPMQPPEQQRASSGQPLAMTLPLTGPHPLGLSGQPSSGGPLPGAGAPTHPALQQQPYSSQGSFGQPQIQHAPIPPSGQNPGFGPQIYGQPPRESMSAPPASVAGVPAKNKTLLFVAIGLGVLALIGVVLGVVVVVGGKGNAPAASASAPSASIPIASASTPPPVVDPAPTAEAQTDASAAMTSDDAGSGSPVATATTAAPPPDVAPPSAPTATATATATSVPVPLPVVVKDAGPPPDPNAFSEATARSRLGQANGVLVFCKKPGGETGPGTAFVTFNSDGTVGAVKMEPPYAGTPTGECVTGHFKRTKVNPFQGSPQTLKHSFEVPK